MMRTLELSLADGAHRHTYKAGPISSANIRYAALGARSCRVVNGRETATRGST